jgi:hypothetical protein
MNAPESVFQHLAIPDEFQAHFDAQRRAFLKAPEPSLAERLADLRALARLLKDNQGAIIGAIDADYGGRSASSAFYGRRPSTPGKPASRSTTPSYRRGPRMNSLVIAGGCSRSAIRTSTVPTSRRSSTSGRTTGSPPHSMTRA